MVVVVEAFSYGPQADQGVLPWVDVLVIRPVAKHVSSTVHQPSAIEPYGVAQDGWNEEADDDGFIPEVPGHYRWQCEAQQHH